MDFHDLIQRQRAFFMTGKTRSLAFRKESLRKLYQGLVDRQEEIYQALQEDLNKSVFESYMTELGLVRAEIKYFLKKLPSWAKNKPVRTPPVLLPAKSLISPEPLGLTLIMAPWNYPIQLSLNPLVASIGAGNCSVLKPSAYAPASSGVLEKILGDLFPPEYVAVVQGGREENAALLDQGFDKIFFTGSPAVGRVVMEAASKKLIPLTLELGGKSPVIVDKTANMKLAARRIAFGKVLNAGQTCVAPDYLLIHKCCKDNFVEYFQKALEEFFPGGDLSDYPRIVNRRHFDRLKGLLAGQKILLGGHLNEEKLQIEPCLLDETDPDSGIMQEEIFGPLLPLITYHDLDECIDFIRARPKPLALYLFTNDKEVENRVLETCSFGGGAINDTIMHLTSPYLPFGGVGNSGMGAYHGYKSFETFSHMRSMVRQARRLDLPMRYHPYKEGWLKLIKKMMD